MRFENEWIFYLMAVAVPLFLYLYHLANSRRSKAIQQFADMRLYSSLTPHYAISRVKAKYLLRFVSLMILLVCLARPQFGEKIVEARKKGIDIIVALDTSTSMLAQDVKPNRMQKAKQEVGLLIDRLRGDRIGLIVFAGTSFVLCPLTSDHAMAKTTLSTVDTQAVPVQGTSLSKAIRKARESFVHGEMKHKALILITDGEDHEGSVLEEAKAAVEEGIKIFTVAVGKLSGVPLPLLDAKGHTEGYKKNKKGEVIVSKVDFALLKEIAELSGGAYLHVTHGAWALGELYEHIASFEKKDLENTLVTIHDDKYQYLLWIAMLLLALEFLIVERLGVRFLRGLFNVS